MVSVLLDGLANILAAASRHGESQAVCEMIEECGGLDKLEDLQNHENEALYQKALEIIETFFNEEEGIEVSLLNCQLINGPPRLQFATRGQCIKGK